MNNIIGQTSGGPDVYGYTWYDSNDPNGPTYNWIDITNTGTLVTGLADDNSVGPISMPDFAYYGQIVNQVKIGSNGWISFGNVSNISHCFPTIPTQGGSGDNYLAPYMTDLNLSGVANPAEVYYYDDAVNNRFIISYINAPRWVSSVPDYEGSNTFQVILDRADYSIYFQYNSMDQSIDDNVNCATDIVVGIENHDGSDGLQHSVETTFQNNYVIMFDSPYCVEYSTIVESVCGSYTSPSGNYTWSNSNTYLDTISSSNNCDSIITIDLTITNHSTGTDTKVECNSYTWIDGNTYTASNSSATYNIVGGAINGCDSIVTLDLTINNVSDLTISTSGVILTANSSTSSYQWLDCDNNSLIIQGETSQSYTATSNGNYAVQITENGCVDTSSCTLIATVDIVENSFGEKLIVFPNPTNSDFSIDLGSNYNNVKISISDISGRLVDVKQINQTQVLNLSIKEPNGVYLVSIEADDMIGIVKLIKN